MKDECVVFTFISKIEDHILDISDKKVDTRLSTYDTGTDRLKIVFTHAGIIETLMEEELKLGRGLEIIGWLESGGHKIWPEKGKPGKPKGWGTVKSY